MLPYEFTLGVAANGQYVCCSSADLAVTVFASPDPATISSPLTYTIAVTNQGPSVARGVTLTNRLNVPAPWLSTSSGNLDCIVTSNEMVCALPDIPPGQSLSLTNAIIPNALGTLVDIVQVGARESDPTPSNNRAIAAVAVLPPVGLSIEDAQSVEGNQDHPMSFPIRLYPSRTSSVTVDVDFIDGTAKAGLDYVSASTRVTFLPDVSTTNVTVLIKGDRGDEPDETFFAVLRNPNGAPIAIGQARGTILDDDLPVVSIDDTAVNVGTNATAIARLTVSLSSVSDQDVLVDYQTSNGTAVAGTDYEAQNGIVRIPAGSLAAVIPLPIAGNTADEREEHFFVTLSNPSNATLGASEAVVTITDEAPVDLTISNATVSEGNVGNSLATFTVTLRAKLQHMVTVEYFTSDGSATAGSDYLASAGALQFLPNETEHTVAISVLGDTIAEGNETFFLTLTNAVNGVLRNARGLGTIVDDDPVPCLSLGDVTVVEGDSGTRQALVSLRLSAPSSHPVTVDVLVPSCRSLPNPYFEKVTVPPGEMEKTVSLTILGDAVHEANDICGILLTNALQATICRGQGLLTVVDDDPLPGLEVSDASVTEGNSGTSQLTFTVNLVGKTSDSVTVRFATQDGTATGGTDFVAVSGTLTFAPGVSSTNLSVVINGDVEVEPDETFALVLSNPANATLFKAQGTAMIRNDDLAPQTDCPSVVVLGTPGNLTCFEPFSPIVLTATPNEGIDKVVRMEFYSGSSLLGVDTSSPFEITWEGAPVGDYCISAKAVCLSGATVNSEATCIGVTDSGAAIAIVRNFDDPEIGRLRDFLLEMGYCARVFDQQGLTAEALATFRLVIWDDLGEDGLLDSTVTVLGEVFNGGTPIYLIGDRLLGALTKLNSANRVTWANLLHLTSLGRSASPGVIAFSELTQDRQPSSILSGRFAEISNFEYSNAIDLGKSTADATPLAFGAGGDLMVQFPTADVSDFGEARSVSQSFRVRTAGGEESLSGRKALFQNSVCWLLRCSYCPLVYLSLANVGVPASVNVGEEFTYDLVLGNNGECIASATIVTNRLPAGLGLVGTAFNQGISTEYNPRDRTLIWRVGSVVSGTENNAILSVAVKALQPGLFKNTACGVANYERFSESNCTEFDLQIEGTAPVDPPALVVLQTGLGQYQLQVTGQAGQSYSLESSTDLSHWLQWTNAPGPLFYLTLPEAGKSTGPARFFRAR